MLSASRIPGSSSTTNTTGRRACVIPGPSRTQSSDTPKIHFFQGSSIDADSLERQRADVQIDLSLVRPLALVAALALLLAPGFATAQTGPVQYGYDELGRLVVVSDGAGNTAIYNYDG